MTVKIGNKEVQLTDYLSANQIQKALYETYEQGYQDGGSDMEQAKQIIIDGLLEQIEQIRAEVIDELLKQVHKEEMWLFKVIGSNQNIKIAFGGIYAKAEQLKEQSND